MAMEKIDFKNIFTHEKSSDIMELGNILNSIRDEIRNGDTVITNISSSVWEKSICAALNNIFTDFNCAGVTITNNTDKVLFGIYVSPTISNVDLMDILVNDEPATQLSRYMVEIDLNIFKVLDPSEVMAYLLFNVENTMSIVAIEFVRFYIDKVVTTKLDHIDIKSSINYSNILIFGIKDTIARFGDLVAGFAPIEDAYLINIRNKVRGSISDVEEIMREPKLNILDWCLLTYTELKTEQRDAIERLTMAKTLTGCRLKKEEIDKVITSVKRAAQETVIESTVRTQINEAKGFSLFKGLKQNGLRTIEDDLYEYKVRTKNCNEQSEAVYILRCINTRIAILEDYLTTTENLNSSEYEHWKDVINQYRELRGILAAKKFNSASQNFNAFLNIDYSAFDRLDDMRQHENAYQESIDALNKIVESAPMDKKFDFKEAIINHECSDLLESVKKASNIGYLNKCKVFAEQVGTVLTQIIEAYHLVNEGAEDKYITLTYKDSGITESDVTMFLDWIKESYVPTLNNKAKELLSKK